jgi:hypothetical protein
MLTICFDRWIPGRAAFSCCAFGKSSGVHAAALTAGDGTFIRVTVSTGLHRSAIAQDYVIVDSQEKASSSQGTQ